jgi:hypothetical protein
MKFICGPFNGLNFFCNSEYMLNASTGLGVTEQIRSRNNRSDLYEGRDRSGLCFGRDTDY